ncbi:MAG: metal-dependent transcriptional regulator [Acidimicrobiales bacterium]|jgi:DtxR family Mn-dependent transcriptional regulator
MAPSAHPPVEEYLQMIAILGEEGIPAVQAQLAKRLGKTPAAVSEVILRLEADGYITRDGRVITLTDEGRAVATAVIRRHRLAERLLVDIIGISWSAAHLEAGRWEHVISDVVEEHLVALLGDPATCPHGNPIPGSHNSAPTRFELTALSDVETGLPVRVARISEDVEQDRASLIFLEGAGFIPGAAVKVVENQPDGTLLLEIGGGLRAVGAALAQRLLVDRA